MQNLIENFDENFRKNHDLKNIYDALRVSPAVTRLTVYRRLQVCITSWHYGTYIVHNALQSRVSSPVPGRH